MRTQIHRWIARALTLCVLGPLCANLASGLRGQDGSEHASFLVSESLGKGAMTLAIVLVVLMVSGIVISRFTNRREAMFNMAMILGWIAWTTGRMGEVFRVSQGGFIQLALEAALIGTAVIVVLVVAKKNTGDEDKASSVEFESVLGGAGLVAVGAAVLAAIGIAWAFGQTDLPGQSLWASFTGGIVAGLVGAMIQQSKSEDSKSSHASLIPMVIGVLLAGVAAPIVGMFTPGSAGVAESLGNGTFPGWLAVSPVSWSVGALLGVPVGWGWLESTVAMQESHTQTA
jgi:hypothetical protein